MKFKGYVTHWKPFGGCKAQNFWGHPTRRDRFYPLFLWKGWKEGMEGKKLTKCEENCSKMSLIFQIFGLSHPQKDPCVEFSILLLLILLLCSNISIACARLPAEISAFSVSSTNLKLYEFKKRENIQVI